MKKLIALLLALMLPLCASAETIREQVNAPETYEATYYSNTKRTKITVDAQIIVPDVEQIPLYAVYSRDFTGEEAWALAEAAYPSEAWVRTHEVDASDVDLTSMVLERTENTKHHYYTEQMELALPLSGWAWDEWSQAAYPIDPSASVSLRNSHYYTAFGTQPSEIVLEYSYTVSGYNYPYYRPHITSMSIDSIESDIKGQPQTYQEARSMADAVIGSIAPNFALRLGGAVSGEICYHKDGTDDYRSTEAPCDAYLFVYTRSIDNVGVNLIAMGGVDELTLRDDPPMAPAPGDEDIRIIVHDGHIDTVRWENPYRIGEMISESSELMPFDQVMDIFGTIAPLSMQSTENAGGSKAAPNNGMEITEIRLGYMPVLDKNNPDQWTLRPVWDFYGVKILPGERYEWPYHSLLTIDAIDGTVIDRSYGY